MKPDSTVEVRPLTIGEESGGLTVVTTGLALNERVVTSNQYRLQAGVHVRATAAAASAHGAGAAASTRLEERIMSISEPFVRRPIATSLLMGGIFLVGLVVYPLLPVAPLPQVDFPTILVTRAAAGRQPRDHGLLGRDAARVPVRGNLRPVADDLDQCARHQRRSRCSSTWIATSMRPRRTCRPGSTPPADSCRRICRRRRPTARSIRPIRRF